MNTIGYIGDSYCASKGKDSWCEILAKKLNLRITNWGQGGASIWNSFINFEKLKKSNLLPDIIFFCWTEPTRLYHPYLPLNVNIKTFGEENREIFSAAENYYKYLQNLEKDNLAFEYSIKYFDQNILSEIKDKKIIQTWSIRINKEEYPYNIKFNSGLYLDESIAMHAWDDDPKNINHDVNLLNHMTAEQNHSWVEKILPRVKNYLKTSNIDNIAE